MSARRGLTLACCLLIAGALGAPGRASATDVRVQVTGVDDRGGDMRVQVCTPETFLKVCPYRAKVPATPGTTDVIVKDVPPGTYAVIAHHDINRDGKVNQTLLGVPEEGVGFSRNPMLIMRAPTFNETAVPVTGPLVEVNIALKFEP
jgi:uncharacterized protein (DUF2141 family)